MVGFLSRLVARLVVASSLMTVSASIFAAPVNASYLGGRGIDAIYRVLSDSATGDVIVVGYTTSDNFPLSGNAADRTFGGSSEGFVARFSADLSQLKASTYFGGEADDYLYDALVDPVTHDIVVVGFSNSTQLQSVGGAQAQPGGGSCSHSAGSRKCYDGVVARLSSDLSQVRRTTYVGGSADDYLSHLARRDDGSLIVVGLSNSVDLPGRIGGAQPALAGGTDGIVVRLSANLDALLRSSYQGGDGDDDLYGLWIDPTSQDVVVVGLTRSSTLGNLAGALQATPGGAGDVQLARFNSDLTVRRRSSFFGGSGLDSPNSMVFDPPTGGLLVAGRSDSPSLPGAVNTSMPTPAGGGDGFVVRIATDLGARGRTSFFGGEALDDVRAIHVQPSGTIVMAGHSSSRRLPGPSASPSSRSALSGFLATTPNSLLSGFITYRLGGENGNTYTYSMAPASATRVCVGGATLQSLPWVGSGAQPRPGGGDFDAFVLCSDSNALPLFSAGFE